MFIMFSKPFLTGKTQLNFVFHISKFKFLEIVNRKQMVIGSG
jgi:hypothetical protein